MGFICHGQFVEKREPRFVYCLELYMFFEENRFVIPRNFFRINPGTTAGLEPGCCSWVWSFVPGPEPGLAWKNVEKDHVG